MKDIVIIGAGLSGLAMAYYLGKRGITATLLEAQDRVGGRIQTIFGTNGTPMEMGATWLGNQHQHLIGLLKESGINTFVQHDEGIALFESFSFTEPQQYFVPSGADTTFRISGGSSGLIDWLAAKAGKENIRLQTKIVSVQDAGLHLVATDSHGNEYPCRILIFAMPPAVVKHTIVLPPALPEQLLKVMQHTQTWMGGSAKFAVEYPSPFWREKGFSGSVFSQSGLATEIYDHCNVENNRFALKGFLNGSAANYTPEERKQKVLNQLVHYFGEEANNATGYHDRIWNDGYNVVPGEPFLPPHYNNGHAVYRQGYLNGKLYFAGTETSSLYGGYMDGAVASAKNLAMQLSAG